MQLNRQASLVKRGTLLAAVALSLALGASNASAAPPLIDAVTVSQVTGTSAVLKAEVNPKGIKTRFHFEYGPEDCSVSSCAFIPSPDGQAGTGTTLVPVEAEVSGLLPGTIYHFRLMVKNQSGEVTLSVDRVFATEGFPSQGLSDGRAYEQATPVNKDGGDAVGELGLVKAASTGNAISFGSAFGLPGAKGAQALPTYLASRGAGEAGWSTQGLLPPASLGERALVLGWLPDFSEVFTGAKKLGSPPSAAFVGQPTDGGPAAQLTPYIAKGGYFYAAADAGGNSIFFESPHVLPVNAGNPVEGASNVYVYDKATGELSLVSVLNEGESPPKGAFAGPYNWLQGISGTTLGQGGSSRFYYLQDEHAVSASGDGVFTASGSGQLYLRRNPTKPQSPMAAGHCTDPELACTLHVSESRRSEPDPAGPAPAAFQAASGDGSQVFFTSPEKLTDNANTGPAPAESAIGTASVTNGQLENADFIPAHAVGLVTNSEYVYWADPLGGRIGRAKLNGQEVIESFIVPPPAECEVQPDPEFHPGIFEKVSVPSTPRYVAVDSEHIYWTNTGERAKDGEPLDGGGTIGRASLDGDTGSIEPGFICGEDKTQPTKRLISNPQGIAVNSSHIYWANDGGASSTPSLGRAALNGSSVEPEFSPVVSSRHPFGVALSSTDVYYSTIEGGSTSGNTYIERFPLDGGPRDARFVGKGPPIRGLALDASHVYWSAPEVGAIRRIDLGLEGPLEEFTTGIIGEIDGLTATPSKLLWSVNGEAPINPGNDLYRYRPEAETLTDLTPDPGDEFGAEVLGVLGTSLDGSRVYFTANGDLDGGGPAQADACRTITPHASMASLHGTCNLYLLEEGSGGAGQISLVARLEAADATDWAATSSGVFTGSVTPKTSFTSKDGTTLLFRSHAKLSRYENEGIPELYRFHVGDPAIRCVSCQPLGEEPEAGPTLGRIHYPKLLFPQEPAQVSSRNLSADGQRAFFETTEALVPADTNGEAGCPFVINPILGQRSCLDVYEWEAPGSASCKEGGPAYSVLDEGCLYLVSTGKSSLPSVFADASESGDDVFFFTRQQLVGQDKDGLQDVYDARVGGGLAGQNRVLTLPCESAEACHPSVQIPPPSSAAPEFSGPPNPKPRAPKCANPRQRCRHHHPKRHHHRKHRKPAHAKQGGHR